VTKAKIVSNTVINGGSSLINAVVTLALTPILITGLGADEYGFWSLLLSLSYTYGYLSIGDLGLGEYLMRSVPAKLDRSRDDNNQLSCLASNSLAASFFGASATIALVATTITIASPWISSKYFEASTIIFAISLILIEAFLEIPCAIYRGFIEGQSGFKISRFIDTSGRIIWGLGASLIVFNNGSIVQLAALVAFISMLRVIFYKYFSKRVEQPLVFSKHSVSRIGITAMIKGSFHLNGLKVLSIIYGQMDRTIIAIFVGVSFITTYDISFRFLSIATLFLATASSAVIPTTVREQHLGNFRETQALFLRGTAMTISIVVPICLGALYYAPSLIQVWIGSGHDDSVTPARLFLLFPILSSTNQIGIAMLTGLGYTRLILRYQIFSVLLNLLLSIVLAYFLGVTGVVLGTLIGNGLFWLPYVKLLLSAFKTTFRDWSVRFIPMILISIVLQSAIFFISRSCFTMGNVENIFLCVFATLMTLACTSSIALRTNKDLQHVSH
jgi:O-antigen/teichoic acid export membrane protein